MGIKKVNPIKEMSSKAKRMDEILSLSDQNISYESICETVYQAFGIQLDDVPVLDEKVAEFASTSRAAIELTLQLHEQQMTGKDVRNMLNQIFGINLDGISSLEGERISLYSKGQWMTKHNADIIEVKTGIKDVDVHVGPTDYFASQTPNYMLLEALGNKLSELGYQQKEHAEVYYYTNHNGEPVSDAFKGKTMKAIIEVIREHGSDVELEPIE